MDRAWQGHQELTREGQERLEVPHVEQKEPDARQERVCVAALYHRSEIVRFRAGHL